MRSAALAIAVVVAAASLSHAQILQGPVHNPVNGSRYFVIEAADWHAARVFARSIGGDLATVNDAYENQWIGDTFSAGGTRKLFIGLSDADNEGQFAWSDASSAGYRNWAANEPRMDDYVTMQPTIGYRWEMRRADYTNMAVVEVTGPVHVPGDYATIAEAINGVQAGATILVGPGTYARFSFSGKGVTVRSTAGLAHTFIDGQGTSPIVSFVSGEPATAMLDGFTVRNGGASPGFGGIRVIGGSSPTIRNCIVTGVSSVSVGGGLLVSNATPTFINCRITGNSGTAGVGATIVDGGAATFINCLFDNNSAISGASLYMDDAAAVFRNCTIVETTGYSTMTIEGTSSLTIRNSIVRSPSSNFWIRDQSTAVVTHSNVSAGFAGVGNISGDPRFLAPGDFRLAVNSPCIDAGDLLQYAGFGPESDMAGRPRARNAPGIPDTGAGLPPIDMGAYEFQPLVDGCAGDFNQSGSITVQDIFDFLAAYFAGCP